MVKTNRSQNDPEEFSLAPRTGAVVPLGALVTEKCPVIGEFSALGDFARFCKSCGLGIIQLLPVNDTGTQSSPYSDLSAFALHPIYISIPSLPEFVDVYRTDSDFHSTYDNFIQKHSKNIRYDYKAILNDKKKFLRTLYETTQIAQQEELSPDLASWIEKNPWIKTYAVYKALKAAYRQATWKSWDAADCGLSETQIKARWTDVSRRKEHLFYAWVQYRAHEQFQKASLAVKESEILLKGDIPIMMNEDSCDVWAHPDIFDNSLKAGSPPDGENSLGQSWGFPTYNWKFLAAENFSWWKERLKSASQYYSAYRLDHILGFFRIWAIPSTETTAYLGHTEPYESISRESLHQAGFDDNRIKWLSQPHVPTGIIEDITWNREKAHDILSCIMIKIDNEELWNFKETIRGDSDIYKAHFENLCSADAASRIKQKLAEYWRNRCLIEIKKDSFVPVWSYQNATAWQTLSETEKQKLEQQFSQQNSAQEQCWKKLASTILPALTKATDMIPCGEDLGVNLSSVPAVLHENKILGLRVIRWNRQWNEDGQPYIPFDKYEQLSVTTTSVHDSPTLRQWWDQDRNAAALFARTFPGEFTADAADSPFSPAIARSILLTTAASASIWCIHPLQDFLYLSEKYRADTPDMDQINIPGTVTEFNWTYRMPVSIETIAEDTVLQELIREIAGIHMKRGCS